MQTVLEKPPAILQASTGIFGAVAAPMGNIDKLVVIDQGNGSADGASTGLARLATTSPTVVFNLLQQLEALGLNLPGILQQLGVNTHQNGSSAVPAVQLDASEPPQPTKAKP